MSVEIPLGDLPAGRKRCCCSPAAAAAITAANPPAPAVGSTIRVTIPSGAIPASGCCSSTKEK